MTGPSLRDQLLAAAEDLFAQRGIDGVSLREINAAAGARNASALQYHFGDRAGLLRAVLAKHRPTVEARRHALLDQYDAEGRPDLRGLAGALVRPLAATLADPGGPGYLQVSSDLANRPRPAIDPANLEDPTDSLFRWRATVEPLLSAEALVRHRRFVAIRFTLAELARRTRDRRRPDDQLFTSDLVDLVTGLLAAPVSSETNRIAEARPPSSPR
ncbi:TetR/AcrR family transcriptional regulator [Aquihabitans sp. G128]|uniref:TetR/AcrR family transcriptional regulator n=1 Tax=Aquihabitans sp. G128 TaxID=2849779 RepID=UPI001C246F0C|nr:TetR family transcriptional regulator [Aquihabitans sp. G128]QXC59972.1 TetR/AcrR family transcriptional regulator [Aquihabitans sp. G128]